MDNLVGKFLLATPALQDPNFVQSVVLIVRHDEEGAFGLVVNRTMPLTVKKALGSVIDAAMLVEDPVYFGGPCQGPVFVLHGDGAIGGERIAAGVYFSAEREIIEALLENLIDPAKYFGSYSGWGPSQLEHEIEIGSWTLCEASRDEIFSVDTNLWSRLHTRAGLSKYVDPDKIPEDPSVN